MIEIDASSTLSFLNGSGHIFRDQLGLTEQDINAATARELAWGVSNIVIRVDAPALSFVLKQSRRQLRTKIDWFSRLERIWREVDVMRVLGEVLPSGSVPRLLAEDRANYLFAMEAIEADHRVWKAELLAGHFDLSVAERLGETLATIHRRTTDRADLRELLGDRSFFDELRLDPFYRYMARTIPELHDRLTSLIDSTMTRLDCLVLADFSPKNILLTSRGPVLVDFETGHFGDPGFDIGFFLSHLLLKAVKHDWRLEARQPAIVFWNSYRRSLLIGPMPHWAGPAFETRCVRHLAACMQSRVDGKSRVDYLTTPEQLTQVRNQCRTMWLDSDQSEATPGSYL